MTDDIPPFLRSAYGRLRDAIDDAESARIRAAKFRQGDWDKRIDVTDAIMERTAGLDDASPAIRAYAARVAAGECRWYEIESRSNPVPPEVDFFKNSPIYRWYPNATPPPALEPDFDEPEPYRIPWE
ncbi:hypothetical protein [Rhodococcus gannanensis]|uniref:Uncharacterized protein n=1 Tax=Rhodococcus gannanensis TaxID=1960308 RepID=A0ABW4PC09_9NOCA